MSRPTTVGELKASGYTPRTVKEEIRANLIRRLREGGDLFEVRQAILGHLQQGGSPSPFDRILATRLAKRCINHLAEEARTGRHSVTAIGLQGGSITTADLQDLPRQVDADHQRPLDQWWLGLRPIARILSQSGPKPNMRSEL